MSTKATSVFKDLDVVEILSIICDKYVVIPADKAINNAIHIAKKHCIDSA